MISMLLAAAAMQPVADPRPSVPSILELVEGEANQRCLPDREMCFALSATEGSDDAVRSLLISSPTSSDAGIISLPLPAGFDDGQSLELWSKLIVVRDDKAGGDRGGTEFLIGVIVRESAMYSGGGGSGGRLHLLRLGMGPHVIGFGGEVLDVVWDSSLMTRACFSEADTKNRLDACHDEYSFKASLAVAPADGGELPSLTYRSVATAYPRTSRRTDDNSAKKLKRGDLTRWRDPECSYTRVLRYNAATARYEMDRTAPDCSDYTAP